MKNEKMIHELLHKQSKECKTVCYFLYVVCYTNYGCTFIIEEELDDYDYPIVLFADTNIENVMKEWDKLH